MLPPLKFCNIYREVFCHLNHHLFFSLAAPQHMELQGQGADLSCSHELSPSCGNTKSLTHRARAGIEQCPCSKMLQISLCHSRSS